MADFLGEEIHITKTKDGIFIKKEEFINSKEFELLKKLNSFKFENRIPSNVNKTLNKEEIEALNSLINKKIVTMYKGGKYKKTGVYSIAQSIYPKLINKPTEKKPAVFGKEEFLIIDNQGEAQKLSIKLKDEIKSGEVRGTRGFDGKFYITTKEFYEKHKNKLIKILEEHAKGLNVKDVSDKTKIPQNACLVILRLLDEDGEILEKRKNVFCLI